MRELVLAVDGGGTKTHAAALTRDGNVVGFAVGRASSPELVGFEESIRVVDALVQKAAGEHASVIRTHLYLAGLDLPLQLLEYARGIAGRPWARQASVVDNDLFALLRAGTDSHNAVAVVCGTGINAVGVRDDGTSVRFPALGHLSGDWGGARGLGGEALWYAARAEDGRGPDTALREELLTSFEVGSILDLVEAIHFGQRNALELAELAPAIFRAARQGDPIAEALVDRQADEIVAFVQACVSRLDLRGTTLPVVLGGGVLESRDERLLSRSSAGIKAIHPTADIVVGSGLPIVGAALLALESNDATPEALLRAREQLREMETSCHE